MQRLETIADTYLSVGTPVQLAAPHFLQRLAELQGGELRIESTPGQQTRVKLVLPLKRSRAMAPASDKP